MNKYLKFGNNLVVVGFGSIGQGVMPLIFRHFEITPSAVTILTKNEEAASIADQLGVRFIQCTITEDNYDALIRQYLKPGDFLLNLSVEVSSLALIVLCQEVGALYLDTCIEPWAGGYKDESLPVSHRSNYMLRESALALKKQYPNGKTAVITHGANPGLVSHFVKQALLNIAQDNGLTLTPPTSKTGWAKLANALGIKAIHIAERDTQVSTQAKSPNEFVNTWSIDGFVSEGSQPAELGWGTHERHWPLGGNHHEIGSKAAIYLSQPGAATRVRTWTPLSGAFHGFLITHGEAISIAEYLTLEESGKPAYRPTVHYAYHPCDDAVLSIHELAGREWEQQPSQRLMVDEVVEGMDELGVLLMGNHKGAYWYGSQLTITEARKLAPYNNATSLQVAVSVLAGMIWAIENPNAGIVEPDEIDFARILAICTPYLGTVAGHYTDWTPLQERGKLFPEKLDHEDPWQFRNIIVAHDFV